jgi:hypothetical protein
MEQQELERRKSKNKKILKYFGIGIGVYVLLALVLPKNPTNPSTESTEASKEAVAQELQRAKTHDSLMQHDKKYADSVRRQIKMDSIAAVERDKITNPENHVEIDMNWHKGGFGSVALAEFTVKNMSAKTMENPVVKVSFYSDNTTLINETKCTVYVTVPPGKKVRSKEINLGFVQQQVGRAGSKLISATWK